MRRVLLLDSFSPTQTNQNRGSRHCIIFCMFVRHPAQRFWREGRPVADVVGSTGTTVPVVGQRTLLQG